jgi:hypothetical protein
MGKQFITINQLFSLQLIIVVVNNFGCIIREAIAPSPIWIEHLYQVNCRRYRPLVKSTETSKLPLLAIFMSILNINEIYFTDFFVLWLGSDRTIYEKLIVFTEGVNTITVVTTKTTTKKIALRGNEQRKVSYWPINFLFRTPMR